MTDRQDIPDDGLEALLKQWGAEQALRQAQVPPLPVSPGAEMARPRGIAFGFWRKLSFAAAAVLILAAMVAYVVEGNLQQKPSGKTDQLAMKPEAAKTPATAPADTYVLALAQITNELDQTKLALSTARQELARYNERIERQEEQLNFSRNLLKKQDASIKDLADSAREAGDLRKRMDEKEKQQTTQGTQLAMGIDRGAGARSAGEPLPMAEAPAKTAAPAAKPAAPPSATAAPKDSAPATPAAAPREAKADALREPAQDKAKRDESMQVADAKQAADASELRRKLQETEKQAEERKIELAKASEDRDKLREELDEVRSQLASGKRRSTAPAEGAGGGRAGAGWAAAGRPSADGALGGPPSAEKSITGAPRDDKAATGPAVGGKGAASPEALKKELAQAPGPRMAMAPSAPMAASRIATAPPRPAAPGGMEGVFGRNAPSNRADVEETTDRPAREFYWAQAQRAVLSAAGVQEGLKAWQVVGRQLKILPRVKEAKAQAAEPTRRLLEQVESALGKLENLDPKDIKGINALRQMLDQQQILAGIDRELAAHTDPTIRQVLVEARLMLTGL